MNRMRSLLIAFAMSGLMLATTGYGQESSPARCRDALRPVLLQVNPDRELLPDIQYLCEQQAEAGDPDEKCEGPRGRRSRSRDRRHQHQVGDGGGEGDLEAGLGLAEVSRVPNPEVNQAADPVLDHDALAVALSESLRLLLLA